MGYYEGTRGYVLPLTRGVGMMTEYFSNLILLKFRTLDQI